MQGVVELEFRGQYTYCLITGLLFCEPAIRLKCTKNLTQNGVPSLRPLFSDSLLEGVTADV